MEKNEKNEKNGIRVILWDIDGTLLDFKAAERNGLISCFRKFGLGECTEEMLQDYAGINQKYWNAMERGEIRKQEVLEGRFVEFFEKYRLPSDLPVRFNEAYENSLSDTIRFFPNSVETVRMCRDRGVLQYVVTNGSRPVQDKKLSKSGFDKLMDGIFISDVVGYEKPNALFFEPVFEEIRGRLPDITKAEIMIVGDSLTSDIQGGINAGIKTCLYRTPEQPYNEIARGKVIPDHEITDLMQLSEFIA